MPLVEECTLVFGPVPRAHPQADATDDIPSLVHAHAALLFRVAHSVLRNPTEAEDVVQDTFLRVLKHRHTLANIRDLRPWLVRISWRLALDRRRRIRPDQLDPQFAQTLAAQTLPADLILAQAQQIQTVLAELDRLPPPERHALLLSAVDDLTTPEIALILGRSPSAVRALLFRARTRLRARLDTTQRRSNPKPSNLAGPQ